MATVLIDIQPRPVDEDDDVDVAFIGDMDEYVERSMCSCNASDDNPY
jgi:hypothetical protein